MVTFTNALALGILSILGMLFRNRRPVAKETIPNTIIGILIVWILATMIAFIVEPNKQPIIPEKLKEQQHVTRL